jgi:Nucleotidyl transferase AbiEii toxin, Type IV TA system
VIARADIVQRVAEWQLTEEVVEKDYVLGWVLWGIATDPTLGQQWVFKGGTCLKKCYIETYRFSEDLDFTVLPGGPIRPRMSHRSSTACWPGWPRSPGSTSPSNSRRCACDRGS